MAPGRGASHLQAVVKLQEAAAPVDRQGRVDGPGDHARSAASWLTGVHPKKTAGADIRSQAVTDLLARHRDTLEQVREACAVDPDLILLDLNLPKRDGREVLKVVKEHPDVKHIPVVIVSTSDREEDIAYATATGAAAYISKSSGFDTFNKELSSVLVYARKP